jgi:hypothetical protein
MSNQPNPEEAPPKPRTPIEKKLDHVNMLLTFLVLINLLILLHSCKA